MCEKRHRVVCGYDADMRYREHVFFLFPSTRLEYHLAVSKCRQLEAQYRRNKHAVNAGRAKTARRVARHEGNGASLLRRMERAYGVSAGHEEFEKPSRRNPATVRETDHKPSKLPKQYEQVGKKINDVKKAQTRPKETDTGKKSYANKKNVEPKEQQRQRATRYIHSPKIPVQQTITSASRCTHGKKIPKSIKPKAYPRQPEINKELSWPISKRDWREINGIHLWIDDYEKKQYVQENGQTVEKYRSKQWQNFVKQIKKFASNEKIPEIHTPSFKVPPQFVNHVTQNQRTAARKSKPQIAR